MDSSGLDLSKLVSVIMENPELISAIKSLTTSGEKVDTDSTINETSAANDDINEVSAADASISDTSVNSEDNIETNTVTASAPTYKSAEGGASRRATLLKALKPYVSKERAKAIDTMMSFAEVFRAMREG